MGAIAKQLGAFDYMEKPVNIDDLVKKMKKAFRRKMEDAMTAATFAEAGVPAEAFCLYPGAGAEIGGAFGGEKETGGGREAGRWIQPSRSTVTRVRLRHSVTAPAAKAARR